MENREVKVWKSAAIAKENIPVLIDSFTYLINEPDGKVDGFGGAGKTGTAEIKKSHTTGVFFVICGYNLKVKEEILLPSEIRVWAPGLTYHITARGNRKEIIFREREDYEVYLMFLKEAMIYYEEYKYQIICFCLMTNHVHIMLKCNKKEPGYFIGRVNGKYTKYFNNKYEYVGHLFQGRYHSEAITNTNHLLVTSKYIHMNPVKAKIIKIPEDYVWSSFNIFIGRNNSINSMAWNSNLCKYDIKSTDIATEEIYKYFKSKKDYYEFVITPGER